MKYRRLGKTELQIPVISCGGMRFQQSWKGDDPVSDESQKNLEACIRRAFEVGIYHFETARGYGTSELQLGRILPQLPRNEIIVQTKIGPESDLQKFVATFEKSMSLLGVKYLDLLAFHGVNNEKSIENTRRCLDTALQWKKEGRIRFLGFSTHAPINIILETIRLGVFDYVNLHWYYIFQDNWPAIEEAHRRDMGVFIISPNDKGGLLYKESEKFARLTAPLHPMVFNDLFCLSRPEVHTLSCGAARPQDFDLHVVAANRLDKVNEILPPIERRLDEEMQRVLGREWMETWQVGLPEWHETPNQINVPVVLRIRNLALAFDMIEYAKMRYNMLGSGDHWFPGQKAENLEQVDLTDCLKRSPHAQRIPALLAETHELLVGEQRKRLQQEA
ncbi:MAG: aldo/keto reductase [Candidatus Hydrogenedentes bacterium]|nr:aldo/keto reductase [Candidatus Hydrogenedentota bacterium]